MQLTRLYDWIPGWNSNPQQTKPNEIVDQSVYGQYQTYRKQIIDTSQECGIMVKKFYHNNEATIQKNLPTAIKVSLLAICLYSVWYYLAYTITSAVIGCSAAKKITQAIDRVVEVWNKMELTREEKCAVGLALTGVYIIYVMFSTFPLPLTSMAFGVTLGAFILEPIREQMMQELNNKLKKINFLWLSEQAVAVKNS